ncbi:MAG: Mur ligase family protein, partial [Candidatus Paceibacterota bacterium]
HINKELDLVVYTIAVQHSNPELEKARDFGIPTVSYPEMLGIISKDKYTIAVSGTHGKTTTTAMLAQILKDVGKSPTVIVGSLLDTSIAQSPGGNRTNFIYGESDIFLVEACEYKRSFLNLAPDILAITNIDMDHLDYYENLKDIQSAFKELAESVPETGAIVCAPDNDNVAEILTGLKSKIVNYDEDKSRIDLDILGKYNEENAKIAMSVAGMLGVDEKRARDSLKNFKGTWRRAEKICEFNGGMIYDDYAHHPTEIEATIKGFRNKFPDKKLIIIFQPHLYSRTKLLFSDFSRSLSYADEVLVLPIYAAREVEDPSISSKMLVDNIGKKNKEVSFVKDGNEVLDIIKNKDLNNSVVITMGAGDVYKIAYEFCGKG